MHSWLDADGDLICTAEEREGWSWGMSMDVIYSIDNVEPLDVDERDEDDFCVEARNSALQTLLDFHRAEISKRRRLAGECDALVLGMLQQRELRAMQPFQRSRLWKKAEDIPGYTVSQVLRVLEKRIYSEEFPCHDDSHETCGPIQDFQKLKSKLLDDVEYRKTLLFTDEMREDAKRQRVIWFGTENPE
ncbi:hypothetical protein QBC41DRAFT_227683 [Cercophora samala]|uniref:Uncharacterized protein n=1 Tax=Cercophora samala TaxID=330535 RepID=A0AA40D926_9PEZI|nr:hypothetical protein QBC41DRAFT_227683 [Cercophora samala]